jgi:glycosyltransferase involved in cell wall biosynthesis
MRTVCEPVGQPEPADGPVAPSAPSASALKVGLLTGGGDRHYAFGLARGLTSKGIYVDFIGGDQVDSPELHCDSRLSYFNFRRNGRENAGLLEKAWRLLHYYGKLLQYAATAEPVIFHILWNNKWEAFDRTLLLFYYRLMGRKLVITAHNVNAGIRDGRDTAFNRLTLRIQYHLCEHIFVHTAQMKSQLLAEFGVAQDAVSVIPYGINNAIPETPLTSQQAKARLGLNPDERVLLFFGNIAPYKGLEFLIAALERLIAQGGNYRLLIAGPVKPGCERYAEEIRRAIEHGLCRQRTIQRMTFIPDAETELYFKAADASVLPYKHIFQSGVLFLGYSFGLPALVADVGSLREDVIEGTTGFTFRPEDPEALANAVERYFASELYRCLQVQRENIRRRFQRLHSWDTVAELTRQVYAQLLKN